MGVTIPRQTRRGSLVYLVLSVLVVVAVGACWSNGCCGRPSRRGRGRAADGPGCPVPREVVTSRSSRRRRIPPGRRRADRHPGDDVAARGDRADGEAHRARLQPGVLGRDSRCRGPRRVLAAQPARHAARGRGGRAVLDRDCNAHGVRLRYNESDVDLMPFTRTDVARSSSSEAGPMPVKRRASRQVRIGELLLGGGAPVMVQSMTNTDTADADATVRQVLELAGAGSEGRAGHREHRGGGRRRADDPRATRPRWAAPSRSSATSTSTATGCSPTTRVARRRSPSTGSIRQRRPRAQARRAVCADDRGPRAASASRCASAQLGQPRQALLARMMDENAQRSAPLGADAVMRERLIASALESAARAEALGLAGRLHPCSRAGERVQDADRLRPGGSRRRRDERSDTSPGRGQPGPSAARPRPAAARSAAAAFDQHAPDRDDHQHREHQVDKRAAARLARDRHALPRTGDGGAAAVSGEARSCAHQASASAPRSFA